MISMRMCKLLATSVLLWWLRFSNVVQRQQKSACDISNETMACALLPPLLISLRVIQSMVSNQANNVLSPFAYLHSSAMFSSKTPEFAGCSRGMGHYLTYHLTECPAKIWSLTSRIWISIKHSHLAILLPKAFWSDWTDHKTSCHFTCGFRLNLDPGTSLQCASKLYRLKRHANCKSGRTSQWRH